MSLDQFITSIDDAVSRGNKVPQQVENVRNALVEALRDPDFLPNAAQSPDLGVPYARRLIHRDPRFTIVAMVWAPGQATPIHDHSGVWCVEGVYNGWCRVFLPREDGDWDIAMRQLTYTEELVAAK